MENIIEVRNLSFGFDGKTIFENINLDIKKNSKILIYGANGVGKSTFLSILASINSATGGQVIIKENLKISYLFQNSNDQFIAPSVIEDVAFSLLAEGVDAKIAQNNATEILEKFEISHLKDRSIYNLSGGEKRLVAIAGALVRDADIYLFDEPFNELDSYKSELVLKNLNEKNRAFVIITHHKRDIFDKDTISCEFFKNGLVIDDLKS
ncbi:MULTISPECIES: ABC transporter ATP-binding protein [unclassified Campylobacter]|uniref:energy-coupling factor ABC transporter ATP-binding protein n=1 Tax=unclassified Campylobacter TaxID=2593542 RepID=UPI001475673D|nr:MULTISPECIES: ABC transporter ATP-binding protein [unclassified Campylobacter]